jgi:hypothetical protein
MRIAKIICAGLLACVSLLGCGPTITKNADPVEVKIKVTSNGKPVDKVTLTLQPMTHGAVQSDSPVVKGECKAMVVPGTYTYYVASGANDSAVQKIPEAFRRGDMERKLEITQAGNFEVQLN